MAATRK
jgi:hypothetical protein